MRVNTINVAFSLLPNTISTSWRAFIKLFRSTGFMRRHACTNIFFPTTNSSSIAAMYTFGRSRHSSAGSVPMYEKAHMHVLSSSHNSSSKTWNFLNRTLKTRYFIHNCCKKHFKYGEFKTLSPTFANKCLLIGGT